MGDNKQLHDAKEEHLKTLYIDKGILKYAEFVTEI